MGIICILQSPQTPEPHVPCDDCCETHCAFPGCHSEHLCWDCFMDDDVYRYVTHAEGGTCKAHSTS